MAPRESVQNRVKIGVAVSEFNPEGHLRVQDAPDLETGPEMVPQGDGTSGEVVYNLCVGEVSARGQRYRRLTR